MAYSTHAYFHPNTAILAAAVHCDDAQDPDAFALRMGLDVSVFTRRGGVDIQGAPPSPQAAYWAALGEARAAAVAALNLPEPNEAWLAADHRYYDTARADAAARVAVPYPTDQEPVWVWAPSVGFVTQEMP